MGILLYVGDTAAAVYRSLYWGYSIVMYPVRLSLKAVS